MTVWCWPEEPERWVCHFPRLGRLQKNQVWWGDPEFHLDVLNFGYLLGTHVEVSGRQLDMSVESVGEIEDKDVGIFLIQMLFLAINLDVTSW